MLHRALSPTTGKLELLRLCVAGGVVIPCGNHADRRSRSPVAAVSSTRWRAATGVKDSARQSPVGEWRTIASVGG